MENYYDFFFQVDIFMANLRFEIKTHGRYHFCQTLCRLCILILV